MLVNTCYSVDAVIVLNILISVPVLFCCAHTVFSSLGSAYTEPFPLNPVSAGLSADEDHGRTSEEEEGLAEQSYDRQVRNGIQRQMKAG